MRKTWFGVELRHLAALEALAEERSFRGAADSLGYVQSAVSAQLAHLEQMLDVRLVERQRGPGSIHLTEAGDLLLSHASDILARFEAARADLDRLKEGWAGRLRLGVSSSVATSLLPALLDRFRRRARDITLEVVEELPDDELWEKVESGALDVVLSGLTDTDGPFEWVECMEDPYVLLVAAESTLASSTHMLEPARLSRLPLIEHRLMSHVEAQLRPVGFEPRYVFRSEVYSTVQALVGGGVGAAILPRLAVDETDEAVHTSPLDGIVAPRTIVVCWHAKRQLTPGLEVLVDTARAVCASRIDAQTPWQLAS